MTFCVPSLSSLTLLNEREQRNIFLGQCKEGVLIKLCRGKNGLFCWVFPVGKHSSIAKLPLDWKCRKITDVIGINYTFTILRHEEKGNFISL